jgi:hypothetical protein
LIHKFEPPKETLAVSEVCCRDMSAIATSVWRRGDIVFADSVLIVRSSRVRWRVPKFLVVLPAAYVAAWRKIGTMKQRILVTGASGGLGMLTAARLAEAGYAVVATILLAQDQEMPCARTAS